MTTDAHPGPLRILVLGAALRAASTKEETVTALLHLVEADARHVCLQRRWYEFLGDRTGAPVTQRAED
ncbi:hypothetical protein ACIGW8_03610 [Streptomyces sioyaensis]|uniref:hypothetical protein n=1 Tax=Streptomyces sioyaensis TaxID=67364 RepID=UPI0037CEB1D1